MLTLRQCTRHPEVLAELEAAVARGWRIEFGNKHRKLRSPKGRFVVSIPCSPSDRRSALNFRRDIRRWESQE